MFSPATGKNIILFDELKPFWRTFCENSQKDDEEGSSVQELRQAIRSKALQEFEI